MIQKLGSYKYFLLLCLTFFFQTVYSQEETIDSLLARFSNLASNRPAEMIYLQTSKEIAEFTLFNANLLPVAERLVYVHPEKKLHITATTNKKVYGTRENARVKIKVTDENGQPVRTHVRVFDGLYNCRRYD